jgi:peptidyl-tRNA hydrolase
MLRMYILVLDDLPIGHAINTSSHAAVACTLRYLDTPEVKEWLEDSFRKVTCKVTEKEFNMAMLKRIWPAETPRWHLNLGPSTTKCSSF